ncbi:hypothetical protein ATANTOWER_020784 [Ataeniobius toweri]|uniref:Uncharacterized protein n=1 Tax=Ataeniobius toweri TaxID=208326 RepID=A0ABU7C303_9TELE|nr:hypothetical protein [Ataeniobius toweri]
MSELANNVQHFSLLLVFALSFTLVLLLCSETSDASLYRRKGICSYKGKFFKPGDTFRRGCDKCFCHEFGFYCYSPMKPTSWPKKCRRVQTDCGYVVVYKENPLVVCRAYSWIG